MDSMYNQFQKAEQFIKDGGDKDAIKLLSAVTIQVWKQCRDGFVTSYQAVDLFEGIYVILAKVGDAAMLDELGQVYWMLWKVVGPLDADLSEKCRDAIDFEVECINKMEEIT